MPKRITQPGALIDTRPQEAKAKDYRFDELVTSAAPVRWIKKKPSEYRKFPIFDQGNSGSCVAQTGKKQLGVYTAQKTGVFIPLSASHIYQRRSNRPGGGMIGDNAFQIMQQGTTLSVFADDERMTDAEMDAISVNPFEASIGESFKIGNYMIVGAKDIDLIASIIQETGKAVMVWFYFTGKEWTARPAVLDSKLKLDAGSTIRHSVAAVDFTLTDDGKKALIIDDSWGPSAGNGAGQRVVDEDFFTARNWFAAHFMNFAFEDQTQPTPDPSPERPKHTFSRQLDFIEWNDVKGEPADIDKHTGQMSDVIWLQDVLKYEGLFPANVDSSGYYGAVTAKAVLAFQKKYKVAPDSELDPLQGRTVGPKTRQQLNKLNTSSGVSGLTITMNKELQRWAISSAVTFVGTFALVLGSQLLDGAFTAETITSASIFGVLTVAARAAVKAITENVVIPASSAVAGRLPKGRA